MRKFWIEFSAYDDAGQMIASGAYEMTLRASSKLTAGVILGWKQLLLSGIHANDPSVQFTLIQELEA